MKMRLEEPVTWTRRHITLVSVPGRHLILSHLTLRAVKAKELEVLSDAVKSENQRFQAYQSQRKCVTHKLGLYSV